MHTRIRTSSHLHTLDNALCVDCTLTAVSTFFRTDAAPRASDACPCVQMASTCAVIDAALAAAPRARVAAAAFEAGAPARARAAQRVRRTLEHHSQVVELLELPQLTETCIRNGLFEEALALSECAGELQRRHHLTPDAGDGGRGGGSDGGGAAAVAPGGPGGVGESARVLLMGIVRSRRAPCAANGGALRSPHARALARTCA